MPTTKLRVGIIGAGDVAQVIHLPTLIALSHLFTISAICDVSPSTASHCASKFSILMHTTDPTLLITHPSIDIIFILTSDEFHAPYAIAALNAGKHVMLEKPPTLSLKSGQAIVDAERDAPNGARVFVGYMRRYAPSLTGAFQWEMKGIGRVMYARVRDIIGPNSYFIGQSGMFPVKNFDDVSEDAKKEKKSLFEALLGEAWGVRYEELSVSQVEYCCLLGGLGSHGLGVMREVLGGLPESVLVTTDNERWNTTIFEYRNRGGDGQLNGEYFTCTYEMGLDNVPRFDSHVTVYGENKTVSIVYDTPFVKGLGITVEVDEMNEYGEKVHRSVQTSYEDAYTAELRELYACLMEGKPIKTSVVDAMEDLKLWKMMMQKYPERNTKMGGAQGTVSGGAALFG